MKTIKEVWGHLWLYDGREIELDGAATKEPITEIKSFGQHELGSEANVFVVFSDGSDKTLRTLPTVRKFFKSEPMFKIRMKL